MQLKNFVSITASLINYIKAAQTTLTDFNVGAVVRTMLEACAREIEELYQQMFLGLKDAIPVAVYNAFGFSALTAQPATGIIRYTITPQSSAVQISGGQQFTLAGTSTVFFAASGALIPAGTSYVDLQVTAQGSGAISPIAAGASFSPSSNAPGFISALALANFSQGSNAETASAQQLRFLSYIALIHRGTVDAQLYAATTYGILYDTNANITEQVTLSFVLEPWRTDNNQPISVFYIYIHNGLNGASQPLINYTQKIIDGYYDENGNPVAGYKAAGVKAVVLAAINTLINVTATITVSASYTKSTVAASVSAAISQYISSLGIGGNVVLAELYSVAMAVPGMTDISFTTPTGDVAIDGAALVATTLSGGSSVLNSGPLNSNPLNSVGIPSASTAPVIGKAMPGTITVS